MSKYGKTIELFLVDGEPKGLIKCTIANWKGVAYKIPRIKLDSCEGRKDLLHSGIYFLFGESDDTDKSFVYIGQARVRKNGGGILTRLQEHKRNLEKDYWTEAVVFTTSDNSHGPTEISYLENRFTNMALDAKRYIVKNGNDPSPGNLTEEKESELMEFIDYSQIVMGTIGYKVLEPFLQAPKSSGNGEDDGESQLFYIRRNGADAMSRLTSEGIVVLSGSRIRKDVVPSCPEYVKAIREDNKEDIDSECILQKDILFGTPSRASSFVLGGSSSGNVEWRTKDGKTLKEVEAEKTGDKSTK